MARALSYPSFLLRRPDGAGTAGSPPPRHVDKVCRSCQGSLLSQTARGSRLLLPLCLSAGIRKKVSNIFDLPPRKHANSSPALGSS
ncbi:hypothetical protein CABS01_01382 [Colletotrichum abscissum]|uniref:Uncharacterized protein n=2 Tax=Colletotrichum acutatum species complex TaxID=2707335 RepID=A0A9Q8SVZ1_9PEZI|nr:uncharacterized protein CLUP02_10026 [Colletotrichum lupini]XP_060385292.1 uncharacterized protein CTAM01_03840 [Colletotrichum tamarilloi]XP_060397951.1 uncharacterized protein CABS01_01382 [Colletotrichum abscissum]KAI3528100.1 hypothetical protein CSPX01_16466 [Colletotrichum filicis]KAK1495575.1 hypothetical protein CABS01_01382 [Colletotrichum abscissum]KAK1504533.1 hypothetical protein CTAM01_03840 [Colletotrichum tamarilloi]UQC84529.1 hypothetical protein CLUP02_10026 [Colletotrichu